MRQARWDHSADFLDGVAISAAGLAAAAAAPQLIGAERRSPRTGTGRRGRCRPATTRPPRPAEGIRDDSSTRR